MTTPSTIAILQPLFAKAQATDEFEYACSLLRPRGLQCAGWEPLAESERLLEDLAALANGPLREDTKTRLALLMYCHVVEMSVPYDLIGNMLRVCQGERYTMDVCQVECAKKIAYPTDKIALIKDWAQTVGFPEVGTLFDRFFENQIRNAFFHSDYVLHAGNFNIVAGKGININGQLVGSIPIYAELQPRIQASLEFLSGVLHLLKASIQAYTQPKTVRGRILGDGGTANVDLLVEPGVGLIGFCGVSC